MYYDDTLEIKDKLNECDIEECISRFCHPDESVSSDAYEELRGFFDLNNDEIAFYMRRFGFL